MKAQSFPILDGDFLYISRTLINGRVFRQDVSVSKLIPSREWQRCWCSELCGLNNLSDAFPCAGTFFLVAPIAKLERLEFDSSESHVFYRKRGKGFSCSSPVLRISGDKRKLKSDEPDDTGKAILNKNRHIQLDFEKDVDENFRGTLREMDKSDLGSYTGVSFVSAMMQIKNHKNSKGEVSLFAKVPPHSSEKIPFNICIHKAVLCEAFETIGEIRLLSKEADDLPTREALVETFTSMELDPSPLVAGGEPTDLMMAVALIVSFPGEWCNTRDKYEEMIYKASTHSDHAYRCPRLSHPPALTKLVGPVEDLKNLGDFKLICM
jgi:hypothetical protein